MMDNLLEKYRLIEKKMMSKKWNRFSEDNVLGCHITSAYSKCFEFNLLVNRKSSLKNSFFYSPALRGICEDLIVLKYLKKDKAINPNLVLLNYMRLQLIDISDKQKAFFSKNHSQQIVFIYQNADEDKKEHSESLRNEWIKSGLKGDKDFPSISHMATGSGLIELYNYLYSATSDMVHFSPHILMRMGWSNNEDKFYHQFSTSNFYKYYKNFNRFYGAYLFVLFTKTFKKELNIEKDILFIINEIETLILDEYRWPELVTFEEVNHPKAEHIRITNMLRKMLLKDRKKSN